MFEGVDIVVDLQTGTISVVLPPDEDGHCIEIEAVNGDDLWAPQE